MIKLGIGIVVTLCAFGCDPQRSPSASTPASAISTPSDAPDSGVGAWPPTNLLYFAAFDREALGIAVDDKYVYWYQDERTFMRAAKSGTAEPEVLTHCGSCNLYRFVADADTRALYFLAHQEVIRVDRESGEQTSIPLDWDHDLGGIAVDAQFVYTAMPGCAAITRVDKRTMQKDVLLVPGVAFPNRAGVTQLSISGTTVVCASPSDLFVMDAWQVPRRVVQGIGSLWGVVALGDRAYWLESDRTPNTIGQVPLAGGSPRRTSEVVRSPQTMKLANLEPIDRLVYGTGDGLQTFDRKENRFSRLAKVGYVRDLAADSEFVYSTIWGKRSHIVDGSARVDTAYWIAKVPLQDLK